MPKKTIKRKSSSRRITAPPLSFWQFIRRNLLIIAGLLLLPVTVGAVLSSYNYANLGSAAGRKGFTLKTQDIGLPVCESSVCKNPGEAICQKTSHGLTGYICTCVATQVMTNGNKCQEYNWRCGDTQDTAKCPVLPTQAPQAVCQEGDQKVGYCDSGHDGANATCMVCKDGQWSQLGACPDRDRMMRACGFVPVEERKVTPIPEQPTQTPSSHNPPADSEKKWEGNCVDCALCNYNNPADREKGCYEESKACGGAKWCWPEGGPRTPRTQSGFDMQKAIKNFFGIFGF